MNLECDYNGMIMNEAFVSEVELDVTSHFGFMKVL